MTSIRGVFIYEIESNSGGESSGGRWTRRASSCQATTELQPYSIFLPSFCGSDTVSRASDTQEKQTEERERKKGKLDIESRGKVQQGDVLKEVNSLFLMLGYSDLVLQEG